MIDRFGDVLVVQITTAGMEKLPALLAALERMLTPETIILRNDTPSRALEGWSCMCGRRKARRAASRSKKMARAISPISAKARRPAGITTSATIAPSSPGSRKAGRVLDAYCYTGGFGILAAKAGAKEVICLDSLRTRLDTGGGERGGEPGFASARSKPMCSKKWSGWAAQKERFDIVIADPPPFVKSRKDLEPGAKAYRKLARLAADVTAPNGLSAAGVLLAQYSAGTLCRGMRGGNFAGRTARPPDPQRGRRPRSSGASAAAGKRLFEGAGLRVDDPRL